MNDNLPSQSPETGPKKRFPLVFTVISAILLIGFLALTGLWLKNSRITSLAIGQEVPDFEFATYSGEKIQTSELRGKAILVNFWSSWCLSCEDEAQALEAAWQKLEKEESVILLGVNYVDTQKDALDFLEKYQITFANGPDLGSRISRIFMVKAVPETYLIDKNGILINIQVGAFQSVEDVLAFLEPVLEQSN